MALYHTHRPQKFSDLVGQDHIRQTLQNALKSGRVAHAYLFAGPRGLGKTTTARLLAKAVNCARQSVEPCNRCESCLAITKGSTLDVLEIDGASNRGIDEVRELREMVKFAPQKLNKKIIIIDEVHMLTKEAFNALLKTLEEPPAHIIFILATTEPHKVPPTILSRVQRFDFHLAKEDALTSHIQKIARQEKKLLEPKAAQTLAKLAEGSFRDGVVLLEQVGAGKEEITALEVSQVFGLSKEETIERFLTALEENDRDKAFAVLDEFILQGGDSGVFIAQAIGLCRRQLRQNGGARAARWIVGLLKAQEELKVSPSPALPLELFIASQVPAKNPPSLSVQNTQNAAAPEKTKNSSGGQAVKETDWRQAVSRLKTQNASLAAILETSQIVLQAKDKLVIAVKFKFHQQKITDPKNISLIEAALELSGEPAPKIECRVDPEYVKQGEAIEVEDDLVASVKEIF